MSLFPQGPAPRLCTFSRASKSSAPPSPAAFLRSSRSERFNQTAEEEEDGESSFLSGSALRSAGFQEKRFFRLPRSSVAFLCFFIPRHHPCPPVLIPFSPAFCHHVPLFILLFCSPWVWLKVTLRAGFHSREREKRRGTVRTAEEGEGQPGSRQCLAWERKFGRTCGFTDDPGMLTSEPEADLH